MFWKEKSLSEMTPAEWDSLCDRCGKCCLRKLEDMETGEYMYTRVGCHLLDPETGLCRQYADRFAWVPDCLKLSVEKIPQFGWLPVTCAYRCLFEGRDLPDWHPLKTGTPDSVHRAGMSTRGRGVIPEFEAGVIEDYIVNWEDV